MKYFFQFILCLALWFDIVHADDKKTICLNMIVKNENKVILRCLASVKHIIDYWVIVDTGSTDGTQDIIRDFLRDVKGELYERPWRNFGYNRNEALQLAKYKADYVLFIDADEVLQISPDFKMPKLEMDFYYIMTEYSGTNYYRVQLINNHLPWKWTGVLHETVDCPLAKTHAILTGFTNVVNTDGFRSQDPQKYQKDAKILEEALQEEPNNTRYVFYLALSYRDAQQFEQALENFKKRISMGGWNQEVFWSLYQVGLIQNTLQMPPEIVMESFNKAFMYRPTRAEPLYYLSQLHRLTGNNLAGYLAARQGLFIPNPMDILFVEHWIYDYGLLLEFSINAYWIERYDEAKLASLQLLANPSIPPHVRECVEKNLMWINAKIIEFYAQGSSSQL